MEAAEVVHCALLVTDKLYSKTSRFDFVNRPSPLNEVSLLGEVVEVFVDHNVAVAVDVDVDVGVERNCHDLV